MTISVAADLFLVFCSLSCIYLVFDPELTWLSGVVSGYVKPPEAGEVPKENAEEEDTESEEETSIA